MFYCFKVNWEFEIFLQIFCGIEIEKFNKIKVNIKLRYSRHLQFWNHQSRVGSFKLLNIVRTCVTSSCLLSRSSNTFCCRRSVKHQTQNWTLSCLLHFSWLSRICSIPDILANRDPVNRSFFGVTRNTSGLWKDAPFEMCGNAKFSNKRWSKEIHLISKKKPMWRKYPALWFFFKLVFSSHNNQCQLHWLAFSTYWVRHASNESQQSQQWTKKYHKFTSTISCR